MDSPKIVFAGKDEVEMLGSNDGPNGAETIGSINKNNSL